MIPTQLQKSSLKFISNTGFEIDCSMLENINFAKETFAVKVDNILCFWSFTQTGQTKNIQSLSWKDTWCVISWINAEIIQQVSSYIGCKEITEQRR